MSDLVYLDALQWLFTNYELMNITIGFITSLAVIIAFFHVVTKWSDV
jgi:multisubunit Na+/H+ antiporter MnhE subunit